MAEEGEVGRQILCRSNLLEASRSHFPRLPVFSTWLKGLFSRFLLLLQGGGTLTGSVLESGGSRVRRNGTARLTCSFQHSVISLLGVWW